MLKKSARPNTTASFIRVISRNCLGLWLHTCRLFLIVSLEILTQKKSQSVKNIAQPGLKFLTIATKWFQGNFIGEQIVNLKLILVVLRQPKSLSQCSPCLISLWESTRLLMSSTILICLIRLSNWWEAPRKLVYLLKIYTKALTKINSVSQVSSFVISTFFLRRLILVS